MKTFLIPAVFAAALSTVAPAEAAECGSVSIAEMKWASAGIAASFDKIILEKGYGCSVTIVDGDTLPTFASMNEKGTPDIASEYWINSVRSLLDQAVNSGRLVQGPKSWPTAPSRVGGYRNSSPTPTPTSARSKAR